MVIAVDFDGTIVEHKYPAIGKPIPYAIDTLKQLQNENHQLILWTVREGRELEEARKYCESMGVFFYAYNSNFPEEDRSIAPRKLKADLFIDDRNFGGIPNWVLIYQAIKNGLSHNLTFNENFEKVKEELKAKSKKKWKLF